MSEQNSYKMWRKSPGDPTMPGWCRVEGQKADTWQDAIRNEVEATCGTGALFDSYQIMSETPSDDGRSGIMDVTRYTKSGAQFDDYFKAVIIEDED